MNKHVIKPTLIGKFTRRFFGYLFTSITGDQKINDSCLNQNGCCCLQYYASYYDHPYVLLSY